MALGCGSLPYPTLALLLSVLALLVIVLLVLDAVKPRNYPPGPAWFPVVGNYPQLRALLQTHGFLHEVWGRLAARYGPVVGLRLGRDRVVVVSGPAAVREVLTREDFDGRPDGFFFRLRCFGERLGIVFTEGAHWQEQRRFALRHLKHFGLGRRGMEARVADEAAALVGALRDDAKQAKTVAMEHAFDVCVLNSLWAMLAGERFSLDDARLSALLRTVHACFRETDCSGGLLNQMPFLRFVAPDRCGYTQTLRSLKTFWAFLRETITEHAKTMVMDQPRDLIDAFLQEMQSKQDADGSTFTEKQLLSLLLDLFMAGAETTSNTLGFCVMFLLRHPEVQARAQAELDRVVGRDRDPSFQDRPQLSYVEAVLMETQRLANTAPAGVAHRAVRDTTIMGFLVPKDTIVLTSLWSVHMDYDHWGDPESFRPERFLDAGGKIIYDDHFLPFGVGRRRCLGETLARSNLFLFLAYLLHNFSLSASPEHPIGDPVADRLFLDGVTLSPKPFYAVLTQRRR